MKVVSTLVTAALLGRVGAAPPGPQHPPPLSPELRSVPQDPPPPQSPLESDELANLGLRNLRNFVDSRRQDLVLATHTELDDNKCTLEKAAARKEW